MTTTKFDVTGMSCGHCAASVRTEVEKVAGVTGVTVDVAAGLLEVTSAAPLDTDAVVGAVDEAGYAATPA